MFNPFYIYGFCFSYVLIVYSFGWSQINPKLSASVVGFLLVTMGIMFVIGKVFKERGSFKWKDVEYNKNVQLATGVLLVMHFLNILYAGHVPLMEILLKRNYNYTLGFEGIPFIQTFLMAGSSFLATYIFHMFLSTRKKSLILLFIINLIPIALVFYRSVMLIILLNCVWVFGSRMKKMDVKNASILLISFLIVAYIFGVSGDARNANQQGVYGSGSELILESGKATQEFRDSIIPKPFFWVYMYSSNPLANFQNLTDVYQGYQFNLSNLMQFVNNDMVISMFSERVNSLYHVEKPKLPLINETFNVLTIFARPYYYLGWLGPVIIFELTLLICVLYYFLLKDNEAYFLTGIAVLNTIIFLNLFDNMFIFSTLAIQLIIPGFLSFMKRMKARKIVLRPPAMAVQNYKPNKGARHG
ncbi:MAG: hypothetical protein HGA49_08500 [Eubacteriaceae bacterium]|nr:hypothetical protein [Eubacteriaceae bacterium]